MTRRGLIPLAVAVATAAAFVPTLSGSFLNWDDNVNFLDNPAYRGLGPEHLRWAFASVTFGHYIPLTRLTWNLNYVLGGMDPSGYHLANVLLHAVNAVLFYFVARRLLAAAVADGAQAGRRGPELCAAAAHRSGSRRPACAPSVVAAARRRRATKYKRVALTAWSSTFTR